ncbi:MAG TPA: OmpA family protein [Stellaceae bacterium]
MLSRSVNSRKKWNLRALAIAGAPILWLGMAAPVAAAPNDGTAPEVTIDLGVLNSLDSGGPAPKHRLKLHPPTAGTGDKAKTTPADSTKKPAASPARSAHKTAAPATGTAEAPETKAETKVDRQAQAKAERDRKAAETKVEQQKQAQAERDRKAAERKEAQAERERKATERKAAEVERKRVAAERKEAEAARRRAQAEEAARDRAAEDEMARKRDADARAAKADAAAPQPTSQPTIVESGPISPKRPSEPPAPPAPKVAAEPTPPKSAPPEKSGQMATLEKPHGAVSGAVAPLHVDFAAGAADLSPPAKSELDAIAKSLATDEDRRVQLVAYASGGSDEANQARRLSLSRALNVRAYLIDHGVRNTRMDVRALGNRPDGGKQVDRVDILFVAK